jgi:hypothetical protein
MNYKIQQAITHMTVVDECDEYIIWAPLKDTFMTYQQDDDADEVEIELIERHADDPDHPVIIIKNDDAIHINDYGQIGSKINVYEKVIVIG